MDFIKESAKIIKRIERFEEEIGQKIEIKCIYRK